jgi:hypothetical protein
MEKASIGQAPSSRMVPPPPKVGPAKKVGVLKISRSKAKPGPRGTLAIELALANPIGVSKKFCLLDIAALSHAHVVGATATRTTRVPALDNLSDDSSLDVHEAPSPGRMMEKPVSPPPLMIREFLHFGYMIFTVVPDNFFCKSYLSCTLTRFATGEPRRRPRVLPSSHKFCFASAFLCCRACSNWLFISQTLALSENQREKRVADSAQVAKIAELKVVARSQAERITELEATRTDFKCEKDKLTDRYQRLVEKHKSFAEKAKHDKTKLAEANATELTKLHADLDLETLSYTEYC